MAASPTDMPARRASRNLTDPRLDRLAAEAAHLMEVFARAGLAEDTALTLTEVTLDRYDQESTYEY